MPAIQWSEVVELDSKLSVVAVGLQATILARVEKLSAKYYGGDTDPRYKLARILLAAHIATPIAYGGGISGPVTSRSEGGVSESYAVPPILAMGAHASTVHGRAFDELTRSMPGRIGPLSS